MTGRTSVAVIVIVAIAAFAAGYLWRGEPKTEPPQAEPSETKSADIYLPIVSLNDSAWAEEVLCYVRVPADLPLKQRLDLLAGRLSTIKFGRLPIDVLGIEERGGRRVAVIDLRNPSDSLAGSWYNRFQGSAGGTASTVALCGTFLQLGFDGEWVDAIEFYYQGKPFTNEWDHVPALYGTIWRDSVVSAMQLR